MNNFKKPLIVMGLMVGFSALNVTYSYADIDNTKLVEEVKQDALNRTSETEKLSNVSKNSDCQETSLDVKSDVDSEKEKYSDIDTTSEKTVNDNSTEYSKENNQNINVQAKEKASEKLVKKEAEVKAQKRADIKRISSNNRFETAINIRNTYFSKSKTVILANSDTFADSLSATSLSQGNTPILFTNSDSLDSKTLSDLKRNKPVKIYVLGGTKSVSNSVIDQLEKLGIIVERISGHDRYYVNAKVAEKTHSTQKNVKRNIVIVSGQNHSDATSSTNLAQNKKAPILFTTKDSIPTPIKDYLYSLKRKNLINSITIVGGVNSISKSVENALRNMCASVTRISGRDRYTTSAKVAKMTNPKADRVIVASGNNYIDSLSMAPVAAKLNAPIILTPSNDVTRNKNYSSADKAFSMESYFKNNKFIDQVILVGGNKSIDPFVQNSISDLLKGLNLKDAPKAEALYISKEEQNKPNPNNSSLEKILANAKKVINVKATAYTSDPAENGGWTVTAIGTQIRRGVIAVDPRVIPLRSRVYVEGYGFATAEDTGGAIKGNRIDVVMDTKSQSSIWGIKNVKVYIL